MDANKYELDHWMRVDNRMVQIVNGMVDNWIVKRMDEVDSLHIEIENHKYIKINFVL